MQTWRVFTEPDMYTLSDEAVQVLWTVKHKLTLLTN